jgi:hypothetical protein
MEVVVEWGKLNKRPTCLLLSNTYVLKLSILGLFPCPLESAQKPCRTMDIFYNSKTCCISQDDKVNSKSATFTNCYSSGNVAERVGACFRLNKHGNARTTHPERRDTRTINKDWNSGKHVIAVDKYLPSPEIDVCDSETQTHKQTEEMRYFLRSPPRVCVCARFCQFVFLFTIRFSSFAFLFRLPCFLPWGKTNVIVSFFFPLINWLNTSFLIPLFFFYV